MRVAALVLVLMLVAAPAFALGDNHNDNDNHNSATAVSSSRSDSSSRSEANVRNENEQGQIQGQLQGQLQGQGQVANGEVNVGGDTIKSVALGFPNVSAAEGTNSATATYLFGSLGLSDTEMYKKGIATIQTVLAIPDEILPQAEKKALVLQVIDKMMGSIRAKRLLGIGPEQHSKNLVNLFGVLSWDSVWAENQKPFQCKSDIKY